MNTSQFTLSCLLLLAAAVIGATPPCTESTKNQTLCADGERVVCRAPPNWDKDPCPRSKPSCVLKEEGVAVCESQLAIGNFVAIVQPEINLQGNSTEKIESPAANSTNSSKIISGGNSTVQTGGGSPVLTTIPKAQPTKLPNVVAGKPEARAAGIAAVRPTAAPVARLAARPVARAAFVGEVPACTAQNRGATYCKSESDADRMRCNPKAVWESFPCPKLTKCVQPQKDVLRAECQPLQQPSPVCDDDSFGKVICLNGKRVTCTPPDWSAFPCPVAEPYCIEKPSEDATCSATPDGTPPTPPAPPTGPVCNVDTLLKYACIDGVRFQCNEIAKEKYVFEPAPCASFDKCVSNPESGAVCQGPRPEWACARNNAYTLACAGRSGLRFLCDGATLQWISYPCEEGRCVQKSRDVEPSCFSNNH